MKLLGLKSARGKGMAADAEKLVELAASLKKPITLMGTPVAALAAEAVAAAAAPEVVDDLDDDFGGTVLVLPPAEVAENIDRVDKRIAAAPVRVRTPPRPGKKLLVLDIDYTLIDHKSTVERPMEMARPFLHSFLSAVYEHYDIAIWSATSMKWVELKMQEMGVLGHDAFDVSFMLCSRSMITCLTRKYGAKSCKPLQRIWRDEVFDGRYTPTNTIMLDDCGRNFVMNSQNGLKIRPYRNCHTNRATDSELAKLARYLLAIGSLPSLSELDHSKWERWLRRHDRKQRGSG